MDNHTDRTSFNRLLMVVMIVVLITIGLALVGFMYSGTFMRLSGDDYCYGGVLTKHGFFRGQVYAYLNPVPFHGNRYSLTLFSLFFSLLPPIVNGVLPAAAIICWSIGLVLVIGKISSLLRVDLLIHESLLVAGFLVVISLYTAPDLAESLYWRSAMLPYLAPLIANIFLIFTLLNAQRKSKRLKVPSFVPLTLAVLAGGFSETVSAIQVGYISVWLILVVVRNRWIHREQLIETTELTMAFSGSLIAIVALLVSPETMPEVSSSDFLSNFIQNALVSVRYANDFILDSFQSLPLPHIVTFILSIVLADLVASRPLHKDLQIKEISAWLFSIIVLCYFLISLGMAPSVYIRGVYPNPRALIAARFILIATVMVAGWVTGIGLSSNLVPNSAAPRVFSLFGAIVFLAISMYVIRVANQTFQPASRYQAWASHWDERDAQIRDDLSKGVLDLEVMQLEKIFQWVAELSPERTTWHNACAADYYGANSISAVLPLEDSQ